MLNGVHHLRFLYKFLVVNVENFFHGNMSAFPNTLADFPKRSSFGGHVGVCSEIIAGDNREVGWELEVCKTAQLDRCRCRANVCAR